MDEIDSHRKSILELVKIAMEQKLVTLNTLKYHKSYLADFTFIGTTNSSFLDSKLLTPSFLDRVDFRSLYLNLTLGLWNRRRVTGRC